MVINRRSSLELFFIFSAWLVIASFASAAVEVQLYADLGDFHTGFVAQDDASSSVGRDGFDFILPSSSAPDNYSLLYSVLPNDVYLTLDSWPASIGETRVFNLTYTTNPSSSGMLDLSWDLDTSSSSAILEDYGSDYSYSSRVARVDMTSSSIYSVGSLGNRYFKLFVTPVEPDCLDCDGEELDEPPGGGGVEGGTEGSVAEHLFELIYPITKVVNRTQGRISFLYRGKVHVVTVRGVSGLNVALLVDSINDSQKVGETRAYDVTQDGQDDISIRINSLRDPYVNITVSPLRQSFLFIPEEIVIPLVVGAATAFPLKIQNNGTSSLDFNLSIEGLSGIVSVDPRVSVAPGETKTIYLYVNVSDNEPHVGVLKVEFNGQVVKTIPVSINARSASFLYDLSLVVPKKYKSIYPGKQLSIEISIQPLGNQKNTFMDMHYKVFDLAGNSYVDEQERVGVDGFLSYNKLLPTENLPPGMYYAIVQAEYPGAFASTGMSFQVSEIGSGQIRWLAIASLLLIAAVVLVFIWAYKRNRLLTLRTFFLSFAKRPKILDSKAQ